MNSSTQQMKDLICFIENYNSQYLKQKPQMAFIVSNTVSETALINSNV